MGIRTIAQSNSPVLQAGKFRHRVTIVQPTLVQDPAGGWNPAETSVVCELWATIEASSGNETYAAQEYSSTITHAVYIRYPRNLVPGGIQPKMIVKFKARTFYIEAVLNADERNKLLQLLCVEVDPTTLV